MMSAIDSPDDTSGTNSIRHTIDLITFCIAAQTHKDRVKNYSPCIVEDVMICGRREAKTLKHYLCKMGDDGLARVVKTDGVSQGRGLPAKLTKSWMDSWQSVSAEGLPDHI